MQAHNIRPIRVAIAEACPVMQTGLITVIEAEMQMRVVATATTLHELIPLLHTRPVDVLVIDIVDMGAASMSLLQEIVQTHPQLSIVVFSGSLDFVPELLAVGVKAYVSQKESDEQLRLAIRAAKAKQRFLSPLAQDYVDRWTSRVDRHRLVPSEVLILKLMSQGLDTKPVADYLGISYRTVHNYVSKIRDKTGCTTRTQMVSWYQAVYGAAT